MYPTERKRYIILGAAIGAVFLFFVVVMMLTQLRDGEDYARQAAQGISITQQTSAARGEIVDATGKAFTGNTTICNITIDSNYFTEQELNPLLLTLTALCRDYGCEWRDELPISTEIPYTFTGEEAALRALRGKLQLSEAPTPEDALYWLRELYNLNDYTDTDVLDRLRSRNKIEDLSDAEALAHAEAVLGHPLAAVRVEATARHRRADLPVVRAAGDAREVLQVLKAAGIGQKAGNLDDRAHVRRNFQLLADVPAVYEHFARIRVRKPRDALEQHRLARTVAAHKAVHAAALQRNGHILEHLLRPVGLVYHLQFDHMRSSFFMLRRTDSSASSAHSAVKITNAYQTGGWPAPSP